MTLGPANVTFSFFEQDACAIDYDPTSDTLYWIDCSVHEIRSSKPDGSQVQNFGNGNSHAANVCTITAVRLVDNWAASLYFKQA